MTLRKTLLLAGLPAGLAALAAAAWPWLRSLDLAVLTASVDGIEAAILSWGAWAPAASVGLMVVHSFLPFPAEMLAVANGNQDVQATFLRVIHLQDRPAALVHPRVLLPVLTGGGR